MPLFVLPVLATGWFGLAIPSGGADGFDIEQQPQDQPR